MSCSPARRKRRDAMLAIRAEYENRLAELRKEENIWFDLFIKHVLSYRRDPNHELQRLKRLQYHDEGGHVVGQTYDHGMGVIVGFEQLFSLFMRSNSHEKAFRKALACAMGYSKFGSVYITRLDDLELQHALDDLCGNCEQPISRHSHSADDMSHCPTGA